MAHSSALKGIPKCSHIIPCTSRVIVFISSLIFETSLSTFSTLKKLIVNALVENIITPIITAIVGESEVSDLVFPLGSAQIQYGVFLQAIIDFLIIALILFMVIQGINRLARKKEAEPKMEEVIVTAEEQYLKEIRDLLAEKQIKANDLKGLEDDI